MGRNRNSKPGRAVPPEGAAALFTPEQLARVRRRCKREQTAAPTDWPAAEWDRETAAAARSWERSAPTPWDTPPDWPRQDNHHNPR